MTTVSGEQRHSIVERKPVPARLPPGNMMRGALNFGAGLVITLLLFSAGLLLADTRTDLPAGFGEMHGVQIAYSPLPELHSQPEEVQPETTPQMPQTEMKVEMPMEIEMPPVDVQFEVNAALDIGLAVPNPPVMETPVAPMAAPVAVSAPAAPAFDPNKIFGAGQLEIPPRLLHASPPAYPPQAMRAGRQGVVMVKVVLDREGRIVSTDLVPGPDVAQFGSATLDAVRRWRFSPGKIGDRTVMCEVIVPVEFNIAGGGGAGGGGVRGGGRGGRGGGVGGDGEGLMGRRRR